MKDIENLRDIEILLESFYRQVMTDDLIGNFFTDTVPFDLKTHIPVLTSFWETILLNKVTYRGNPMDKHFELNKLRKMEPVHFERWLYLWEQSVNSNFSGAVAAEAINRAKTIAGIMLQKLIQQNSGQG